MCRCMLEAIAAEPTPVCLCFFEKVPLFMCGIRLPRPFCLACVPSGTYPLS